MEEEVIDETKSQFGDALEPLEALEALEASVVFVLLLLTRGDAGRRGDVLYMLLFLE